MGRFALILTVVAFVLFVVAAAREPVDQSVGLPAIGLLGLALVMWGIDAIRQGTVRVKRHRARRESQPVTFWLTVVLARLAPGAILLVAALWLALA